MEIFLLNRRLPRASLPVPGWVLDLRGSFFLSQLELRSASQSSQKPWREKNLRACNVHVLSRNSWRRGFGKPGAPDVRLPLVSLVRQHTFIEHLIYSGTWDRAVTHIVFMEWTF